MIYLDTSVLLAALLSEDRRPPVSLWDGELVSSRLLEVEVKVRIRSLGRMDTVPAVEALLHRVGFVEMDRVALAPAFEPWAVAVRTLDAIHLAAALHLTRHGTTVRVATYDRRLAEAASALGVGLVDLP